MRATDRVLIIDRAAPLEPAGGTFMGNITQKMST
jgi:hypothetical protein